MRIAQNITELVGRTPELTNQIDRKQQQIADHLAENEALETALKHKDEQLLEKNHQISAKVAEKQQLLAKMDKEKSRMLNDSSNKEKTLKNTIFNLEIELKSSQSAMEALKRDLTHKDSLLNEQSSKLQDELISKHELEKQQLQAALTAKERHLNEAILSIRHEADGTARQLYKANLDKKRFQDNLEKSEEDIRLQVCCASFFVMVNHSNLR